MLPIRIKHLPQFIRQMFIRERILELPDSGERIFHLCFFSCQSYFRYLYCSLHSLALHAKEVKIKILVFSDDEMPLSSAQIEALRLLMPDIRVIPWPKSMGWGATQIGWIWKAYQLAADGVADGDFIARVDSDVFFFNDRIFKLAARSDADLIGDGHYVDFRYCQGGCYFFRASAVRKITAMLEQESIEQVVTEIDPVVEDVAASHFAKRLGLKIFMTWMMMFPDELRNAGGLTSWQRWKFSCAHFVMKNKVAMLIAYEKEVLGFEVSDEYREALNIS
jgi:hypothetical protein